MAVLYALRSPAFDVLGLTTVAGNIGLPTTTTNAAKLLTLAGRALPVHAGADRPLARTGFGASDIHGADGLGGVPLPAPQITPQPGAVDWIATTLEAQDPGTVDLFTLGPLTNLAHLLENHPQSTRRLRRVIAMGGAVDERGNVGPRAEFNIAADPEAAARVFAADLPLTLIPLDVTRRVRASTSDTAALAQARDADARTVGALIDAYFLTTDGGDSRPLHDPCVMLFAESPALFSCETRHLDVETSTGPDAGALIPGPYAIEVAMGVDGPAALAHLRDAFLNG